METEARPVLTKVENESQMISIPYRIEMISLFLCDLKENKIPFRGRKKNTEIEWLRHLKFNLSQFWRQEVQDQEVSRFPFF